MMKRATLLLDDSIYLRARQLSQQRGTTLKEIVNDLLRKALNATSCTGTVTTMVVPLHRNNGPRPGIDLADRTLLYDVIEGRLPRHPK